MSARGDVIKPGLINLIPMVSVASAMICISSSGVGLVRGKVSSRVGLTGDREVTPRGRSATHAVGGGFLDIRWTRR